MAITLDGTSGLIVSGNTNTLSGVTVGRGAGDVSTNTVVGAGAFTSNSTGTNNVAVGRFAGVTNTGSTNTFVGDSSGYWNSSGSNNVGVGFASYAANTTAATGSNNTAIGREALYNNTTASNNTALGYQALYAQTTASGGHNTAVGVGALKTVTTGYQNVAVGYNALNLCTGAYNVAVGENAGGAVLASTGVVIIGGYDGNADGLDIRNATDYVVISTGQGTRQLSMKEGYTLALDSAVPNAGTGITFPATQSASSDANTLDDYEEGTWTPSVGGTATYTYQFGTYVKIGRFVYISGQMTINILGTGSTFRISGLPFTVTNTVDCVAVANYFTSLAANVITPTLTINASTTTMDVYSRTTAGVASASASIFGNSANLAFTGHYIV